MAKRFMDPQAELAAVLEITRSAHSAGDNDETFNQLEDYFERRADISANAEAALLARLDIATDLPSMERWALVGLTLAMSQPEFKEVRRQTIKLRSRGRPRKSVSKSELLADFVDGVKGEVGMEGLTDKQILGFTQDVAKFYRDKNEGSEFNSMFRVDIDSLRKRVSEGRRVRRAVPKK